MKDSQLALDDIGLALELTTQARNRLALGRPPSSALVPLERAQQELRQARARVRDELELWPDVAGGTVQSVDGSVRDGPTSSHERRLAPLDPLDVCDACVPGPGPNCDDCIGALSTPEEPTPPAEDKPPRPPYAAGTRYGLARRDNIGRDNIEGNEQ